MIKTESTGAAAGLGDLFAHGKWYHCIRHAGLTANGVYDIDQYLDRYHLPESFSGRTVLDVGCADGYFSLLARRRGAARVRGVDSNRYDGSVAIAASHIRKDAYARKYEAYVEDFQRFHDIYARYGLATPNKLLLVAAIEQLEIEFEVGTIYDLSAQGAWDIVFCNDLLEHLRDPITAIEQVASVTGSLAVFSVSSALKRPWFARRSPLLEYQGHLSGGSFYRLSEGAVQAMCLAAGFRDTRVVSRFDMANRRDGTSSPHVVIHARK
jgi:tRNA (mo5U34)-methyltransferase